MNKLQASILNEIVTTHDMITYSARQQAERTNAATEGALNGRAADYEVVARGAAELAGLIARRDALARTARMAGVTTEQVAACFRDKAWFEATVQE